MKNTQNDGGMRRECWADLLSRPARALWVEIWPLPLLYPVFPRRGPRGPCGLKCIIIFKWSILIRSRPARALWVEISDNTRTSYINTVAAREGLVG